MFQRQFVSELRRCEEMERQLSMYFVLYAYVFFAMSLLHCFVCKYLSI